MSRFYTEKQIEAGLESETRELPMPDGSVKHFRSFKMVWEAMDYLILTGGYDRARLVEIALMGCEEMGYSFEESFPDTVYYAYHVTRRQQGFED